MQYFSNVRWIDRKILPNNRVSHEKAQQAKLDIYQRLGRIQQENAAQHKETPATAGVSFILILFCDKVCAPADGFFIDSQQFRFFGKHLRESLHD